jgi:hypothetical protein
MPARQVRCVCYPCSVLFDRVQAFDPAAGQPGQVTVQDHLLAERLDGVPPAGERHSAASLASGARFRLIPQRRRYLADFALSDAEWDSLRIPVGIAFVLADGTAFYPGALGATQAFLDADVWQAVQVRNPMLRQIQPEVEALLVNRVGEAREHYLVPIDDCYRLVGLIRTSWRGLTGGREVWSHVDAFFQGVKAHVANR